LLGIASHRSKRDAKRCTLWMKGKVIWITIHSLVDPEASIGKIMEPRPGIREAAGVSGRKKVRLLVPGAARWLVSLSVRGWGRDNN
jgi:hypothetical protein